MKITLPRLALKNLDWANPIFQVGSIQRQITKNED